MFFCMNDEKAGFLMMARLQNSPRIGSSMFLNEPRCEKTGLRGFQPDPTQTELYNQRRWLDA